MEKFSLVVLLGLALLVSAYRGTSARGDEDIRTILQELRDNDARQEEKIALQEEKFSQLFEERKTQQLYSNSPVSPRTT